MSSEPRESGLFVFTLQTTIVELWKELGKARIEGSRAREVLGASSDRMQQLANATDTKWTGKSLMLGKASPMAEEAHLVFAHWQRVMAKPNAKMTQGRKSKITARLRDGYTVDDLCKAVDGCASSSFHMGDNEGRKRFDDLTLICRNGENVERFRDMVAAKPKRKSRTTSFGEE